MKKIMSLVMLVVVFVAFSGPCFAGGIKLPDIGKGLKNLGKAFNPQVDKAVNTAGDAVARGVGKAIGGMFDRPEEAKNVRLGQTLRSEGQAKELKNHVAYGKANIALDKEDALTDIDVQILRAKAELQMLQEKNAVLRGESVLDISQQTPEQIAQEDVVNKQAARAGRGSQSATQPAKVSAPAVQQSRFAGPVVSSKNFSIRSPLMR